MTLNQHNIVAKPPIKIDSNAFLIPGLVNVEYANPEDRAVSITEGFEGEEISIIYDEFTDVSEDTGVESNFLRPPDSAEIVEQIVRVAPDGRFVVDVVLEVENISGVSNYDVGITKGVSP